mgnify:CR=1 FL=1
MPVMKQFLLIIAFLFSSLLLGQVASAQCSICTKTAQQLGEKPAKGMNGGILYLAFAPFGIAGLVIYRWRQSNKES